MKYFKLIRSAVDVAPLLAELRAQPEAWLADTARQDKIRVQRDTNTIFLRSAVPRPDLHINENQESRLTAVSNLFPRALAFMTEFAGEMNCHLSRATIVRLKPKSQVGRHIDEGSYYFLRDRFHLVLESAAGSVMRGGDEEVRMQEGELWWFDNKQFHESYNDSEEWRVHYIFDLLAADYGDIAVNPVSVAMAAAAPLPVPPAPLPAPVNAPLAAPPAPILASVASGPMASATEPNPVTSAREMVSAAIRERGILRAENQRLISPKGRENQWLIDTRRIFMDAKVLDAAAELFWQEWGERMPFQVGGMEAAAIPLLSAILLKSLARGTPVNGFIVRKERKTYGTGGLIEGMLTGVPIVMVDDILNSGSSLEKARVVLEKELLEKKLLEKELLEKERRAMSGAFVLIDYESAAGRHWRERHGIPVTAAFRLAEFGLSVERLVTRLLNRPMTSFENRWNFAALDPNFFHRVPKSFPATDGKRVYFGSDGGQFWCLDAASGTPAWSFRVNAAGHKNIWSSPALHDGRVYFGSYDGNVYCLNAESGEEVWRYGGADWVGSSPALAPALGLLFIGLEFAVEGKRGSIVALRMENGDKVWEHRTRRYTHASPAYWRERQLVACGSNDNEMFLFDAATGTLRWRFETRSARGEKASIRHAPAFDTKRSHLVTGCANGRIYIIDVETGQEVWWVQTDNTIYTVPLVVEDRAYVGSTDKHLYVLDLERRVVEKKVFAGAQIFGPPRLIEGRIYFGACNGMVYETAIDGEITGSHQLPDAVTNSVIYSAETGDFYALTYVNELFAFRRVERV